MTLATIILSVLPFGDRDELREMFSGRRRRERRRCAGRRRMPRHRPLPPGFRPERVKRAVPEALQRRRQRVDVDADVAAVGRRPPVGAASGEAVTTFGAIRETDVVDLGRETGRGSSVRTVVWTRVRLARQGDPLRRGQGI